MKLFNEECESNDWRDHWVGMPEFVQEKKEPFAKIIIRVDSEEGLEALSKALGQPLTTRTKSAWFPFKPHRSDVVREWVHNDSE